MHYEISEETYYLLQSCRSQIRFVTDLCDSSFAGRKCDLDLVDLASFLRAQEGALLHSIKNAIFKTEDELRTEGRAASPAPAESLVTPDLMVRVMDACSGSNVTSEALQQIYAELLETTMRTVDDRVLMAFLKAVRRQGFDMSVMTTNGESTITFALPKGKGKRTEPLRKTAPRKRERLTAGVA